MSLPRAHVDDVEASYCCRGPVSSHDDGCVNEKELSVNLVYRQDSLTASPHITSELRRLYFPAGISIVERNWVTCQKDQGSTFGCTYEGEWRGGMRHGHGHGKRTWPSGAVYDGEFSSGYMHGNGTYSRPGNLTYKGRWKLNLKHGLGYQTYPNGDVFEGSWMQGVIEGHGRKNVWQGNSWNNGDTYDENWVDGMMDGFGVYTWVNGGCYVGSWSRGLKDGKGSFYPKGIKIPAGKDLYLNALRKQGLSPDFKRQNHGSRILHASSVDRENMKVSETQESDSGSSINIAKGHLINYEKSRAKHVLLERRWSLEVAIEKNIGHDRALESFAEGDEKVIDMDVPILEREYMQGVLISEIVINNSFLVSPRKVKKASKKTDEGHKKARRDDHKRP